MARIKITQDELKRIVKESNKKLLEDRVSTFTDSIPFTQSTPSIADEASAARKIALKTYEKYVDACLESLRSMVDQVNSDFTNDNLQKADVDFLISHDLGRLQDGLNYTASSLEAIVENDGLKKEPAGAQYPAMMEDKKNN